MNRHTLIILITSALFMVGCGKGKEAQRLFDNAKWLYENQQFTAAKNAIDSINLLYPKEIEIRKEALTLMRQVEHSESEQNIAFCDSVLPIRIHELDSLTKGFILEKDANYNPLGNYVPKGMTVERNVERSYIRCGVNEEGEMYVSSVYFGGAPINHTGLKLSSGNDTYAETPSIQYDGGVNYRFKDNGNTTEVVTYKGANCKDIANYVYINVANNIKAEYRGGKPFTIILSTEVRKSIKSTYELALVLSEINAMQKAKARSEKKLLLIDEKLKKGSIPHNS